MSKTYHIWTMGCQMNEADSRQLSSQLEAVGYRMSDDIEAADLVVLNTCVVRQQAEDRAVGRLTSLKKVKEARPDLTIGLMGCMVGMREAPALKKRFPFVDVFMPPSDGAPLLAYLEDRKLFDLGREIDDEERAFRDRVQDESYTLPDPVRDRSVTAHVPVVLGCSHACTFCVIPYRRGGERSRSPEDIVAESQKLAQQGIREIMLLGQIVDRYGTDLDEDVDLADLLVQVADIPELARVRFLTSHPNWMTDKLIETVAQHPKLAPQFEVPVQAGNDQVLETMQRGYTADEWRRVVERIREHVPDAAIHTDIIVGFCGETREQFMDTYRLMEEARIDKIHSAKYSERPKTIAARRMEDDVSAEEKSWRHRELDALQERILEEKNAELLGQEVEVLVEAYDERKERWRGRTPQAKLVFFPDERNPRGKLVRVKIQHTSPYSLIGERVHRELPALFAL